MLILKRKKKIKADNIAVKKITVIYEDCNLRKWAQLTKFHKLSYD